jgi:hypothetical protein
MTSRIVDDPTAAGWVETSTGFWEYKLAPLVEEAPVDTKQYARQDAAWSEVVIPEVPDFVETDPTVPAHVKAITTTNISHWNTAWDEATEANGWGNHADAGYAKYSDDPATFSGEVNATTAKIALYNFSGQDMWTASGSGVRFNSSTIFPLDGAGALTNTGPNFGSSTRKFNDAHFAGTVNANTAYIKAGNAHGRNGSQFGSNNGALQLNNSFTNFEPTITDVVTLGSTQGKFKDAYFSGEVNANKFVGDGSGLTGLPASGISATDVTALYEGGSAKKVYTYGSGGRVTGNLLATSDVYAYYSDERLKTKTGEIENALDKVEAIDCFYYTHNDIAKSLGYEGDDQQVGVSAQSVKAVMPECVGRAPIDDDGMGGSVSGEDYMTVKYERLVPLLLESIKQLNARVKELEGDR